MIRTFFGFIIGALLGAMVGVTVGILFAPASGAEVRGQIRERGAAVSAEIRNAAIARKNAIESHFVRTSAPQDLELPPQA